MELTKLQVYGRKVIHNYWDITKNVVTSRLYVVNKGYAWYMLDDKPHILSAGHLYFFPPLLSLRFKQEPDIPLDHTYLQFITASLPISKQVIDLPLSDYPTLNSLVSAFNTFINEYHISPSNHKHDKIVLGYLDLFLSLIRSVYHIPNVSDKRIEKVVSYISEHYNEPILVEEMAAMVYLEVNYFIKLFRSIMHVSPHQYLKDFRLSMASEFLHSGLSIQETASRVGYSSGYALSAAMKKRWGYSPSALIRNEKKNSTCSIKNS